MQRCRASSLFVGIAVLLSNELWRWSAVRVLLFTYSMCACIGA